MKTVKTYTQFEINSNINKLTDNLERLKLQRQSLNKDINNVKKQIKYWEELDENQYKMFDDE